MWGGGSVWCGQTAREKHFALKVTRGSCLLVEFMKYEHLLAVRVISRSPVETIGNTKLVADSPCAAFCFSI